ncbi:LacI family DNA-binding transcriptional regulator [Paenibacillus camelliae]|uniref:LacI family DNA-binding transcriptional regulator n=1 Tax=Paenibacillus camelliae TaxID=512410 RepID=UPI00203AD783|nr:LacI family DNA-binding transcriptional regulator [Paenibacillus camelliae]MCM3634605.1 LacI family transcriptional regulator [Paenibacillus camelliae]
MKITIADVAQKAKVSKTTVSRIINGNYAHTTEETKQKVLRAIEELEYRPNALAQGLKATKTNVIGMILSNLKNPFWSTVLEGIEDTCRASGYHLMIFNSNENELVEKELIKEFKTRRVDGIIIHPTCKDQLIYDRLIEEKHPLVIINRRVDNPMATGVVVDNVKGAYIAVNHLLKYGRTGVAVAVFQNPYVSTWKERVEGYKKAMLANGYAEEQCKILELEEGKPQIEPIKRWIKRNSDVDAIFSTNTTVTLEVIGALKDMGKQIPHEIAIVSYDETIWSKYIDPPLTTIKQPGYVMGQQAAQCLIDQIETKEMLEPQMNVLVPELIIRASCGAIPQD